MKVKVDVRNRTGYNDVEDIHVSYEINQTTGSPVSSIRANIERDDKRVGTVTVERDGRLYISLDYANDISFDTKREVLTTILTDVEKVFNEPETDNITE